MKQPYLTNRELQLVTLVLTRPAKRCPLNSENPPQENCLLKSGILPKIRLETTENIFPDAKNAFLAAHEDTKVSHLRTSGKQKLSASTTYSPDKNITHPTRLDMFLFCFESGTHEIQRGIQ